MHSNTPRGSDQKRLLVDGEHAFSHVVLSIIARQLKGFWNYPILKSENQYHDGLGNLNKIFFMAKCLSWHYGKSKSSLPFHFQMTSFWAAKLFTREHWISAIIIVKFKFLAVGWNANRYIRMDSVIRKRKIFVWKKAHFLSLFGEKFSGHKSRYSYSIPFWIV